MKMKLVVSDEPRWTVRDVASWRKRSVRTIYRLVAKGLIPAKLDGGQLRFDPAEVRASWAALPPAASGRSRGLPPSPLGRRPIEQVLTERAKYWYAVPDELAIRRAQKEAAHGSD